MGTRCSSLWAALFLSPVIAWGGAKAITTQDHSPKANINAGSARKVPRRKPADPDSDASPAPWCAPELEPLDGDTCFLDANRPGERRTLVLFLHGVVNDGGKWQWLQQRALASYAKKLGFAALMPRAPLRTAPKTGFTGRAWDSSFSPDPAVEKSLVERWLRAKRHVEAKGTFDEFFVIGFSSGAYYAASLALRSRLSEADGYALFAGGAASRPPSHSEEHRVPVFVGICAKDASTAPMARALAGSLAAAAWPHRTEERPVGHMFSEPHVASALDYLRGAVDRSGRR